VQADTSRAGKILWPEEKKKSAASGIWNVIENVTKIESSCNARLLKEGKYIKILFEVEIKNVFN
jgi:hypothetical protein